MKINFFKTVYKPDIKEAVKLDKKRAKANLKTNIARARNIQAGFLIPQPKKTFAQKVKRFFKNLAKDL